MTLTAYCIIVNNHQYMCIMLAEGAATSTYLVLLAGIEAAAGRATSRGTGRTKVRNVHPVGSRGRLQPVSRETTAGLIAAQLRRGIMNGTFAPGQQLAESQIAKELEVSRGPLREAMQRLIQEGLLRGERNRGLFVIELGDGDVREIYLARQAIEQTAVRLMFRGQDGQPLDQLRKTVERMHTASRLGRWSALADLDLRFHAQLVAASGSHRMERVIQTLLIETRMCLNALEHRYQHGADLAAEHSDLLKALAGGDEMRTLELIRLHMEDAIVWLTGGENPEPAP